MKSSLIPYPLYPTPYIYSLRTIVYTYQNYIYTLSVATSTFAGINLTQSFGCHDTNCQFNDATGFQTENKKTHRKIVKWEPQDRALTSKYLVRIRSAK
jgi:hypothetical protein